MPLYRAQVTFQGATNIAEDRFINTLHFIVDSGTTPSAAAVIGDNIHDFYNTPTGALSIGGCISSFVNRAATIRYYDMSQAEPRVPHIDEWTLNASTGDAPLPEEVAVVASFHGGLPVTPRTRGRIFLGPLNGAVTFNSGQGVKVTAAFRDHVCNRMAALAASDAGWVVHSPTTGNNTVVSGGFCDNAFDTMRKRGPKATGRSIWPAIV